MEELWKQLKQGENVRETLISIRSKQKEEGVSQGKITEDRETLLGELLSHEDPKVRKNAALLIGELSLQSLLPRLYQSYITEETRFIRSDYLKAMSLLSVTAYVEELQARRKELLEEKPGEDEEKHYRQERTVLQKLLEPFDQHRVPRFTGMEKTADVVLLTYPGDNGITEAQLGSCKKNVFPFGIRVPGACIKEMFAIRTFREMLFSLNIAGIPQDPKEAAEKLVASNFLYLLDRLHRFPLKEREKGNGGIGGGNAYYLRIRIGDGDKAKGYGEFYKKLGFYLEERTAGSLCKHPTQAEVELRLIPKKDGTFLPLVCLYTLKDPRFIYRKEVVATSIAPAQAALLAQLAKPYLQEKAQVLDPFCGVGTMLVERDKAVEAATMYGVDLYGEAIAKARFNTKEVKRDIYFVQRDCLDFSHTYLFDEIFTNMPTRGKHTREEQDSLFEGFFQKAEELLRRGGRMILYTNERGFLHKQLRLREEWHLLAEHLVREKDGFYLFVLEKRK